MAPRRPDAVGLGRHGDQVTHDNRTAPLAIACLAHGDFDTGHTHGAIPVAQRDRELDDDDLSGLVGVPQLLDRRLRQPHTLCAVPAFRRSDHRGRLASFADRPDEGGHPTALQILAAELLEYRVEGCGGHQGAVDIDLKLPVQDWEEIVVEQEPQNLLPRDVLT
jgi:hypothetical protein